MSSACVEKESLRCRIRNDCGKEPEHQSHYPHRARRSPCGRSKQQEQQQGTPRGPSTMSRFIKTAIRFLALRKRTTWNKSCGKKFGRVFAWQVACSVSVHHNEVLFFSPLSLFTLFCLFQKWEMEWVDVLINIFEGSELVVSKGEGSENATDSFFYF